MALLALGLACANSNSLKPETQSLKNPDYVGDKDLGFLALQTGVCGFADRKLGTGQCVSSPKYKSDVPDTAFQS